MTTVSEQSPEREPGGMQRLLAFVERGIAAQNAVDSLIDPDPARPTDDTVDSEPHPDEDGPAYDRDRDERDYEPILPDLSPLDDGPGHDQRGPHRRPHRRPYNAGRDAQPFDVIDIDPGDMLGERVSVEHVGLPSPDAHAVAATVEPELETRVRNAMYEHERGNVSRRTAARQIIRLVREASAPAYTPWLTLSAAEIERVLTDCPGIVMQAQDTGDEETPHDLTVSECAADVEECTADLDEDDPDPCVLLVSEAFPGGRMHTPPFELVAVRIGAEA